MDKSLNQEQIGSQLAHAIRQRREQLHLTLDTVAKQCGWENIQTLSAIERGKREVKAAELALLAQALHCQVMDFFSSTPPSLEVAWRNRPSENAELEQERFRVLCENYHLLEIWTEENSQETLQKSKFKHPEHLSYEDVSAFAESICEEMQLGRFPALTLRQTLEESYDVKLFFLPDFKGSAASARGDFGCAMVINSGEYERRRIYSVAHELFHLLTWEQLPPILNNTFCLWSEHIERLAEVFASSLLLPKTELSLDLEQVISEGHSLPWQAFIDLADRYRVSRPALVWRLVSLKYLTNEQARTILDYLSSLSSKQDETEPPITYPNRFWRLLKQAYVNGEVSARRAAEMVGRSYAEMWKDFACWDEEAEEAHADIDLEFRFA